MPMKTIEIYTDYITLGQMLKFAGIIRNGGEAKAYLLSHEVCINGELDNRRGRKLYDGCQVKVNDQLFLIKSNVLPN